MDSNERKIIQELVTALGCVIPASDRYEPRTNLWNKYSAAKNLLAAAPQVVADERAAYPGHILETATELARCIYRDNYKNEAPGWEPLPDLAGVLSQIDNMVCGMRRAAPVQAQELSEEIKSMIDEQDANENAETNYCAPVQPVAVPDELLNFSTLITYGIFQGNPVPVMGAKFYKKSDVLALLQIQAAPAAQGDALSDLLDNMLSIEVGPFDVSIVALATDAEREEDVRGEILATEPWHKNGPSLKKATAKAIERAIAAKAAS